MVAVLNDFRLTGDWQYALRWVPAKFFLHKALKTDPNSGDR